MEEVKVFFPLKKSIIQRVHVVNLTCVSFRYILLLLVLFAIPGLVMIVAYGLISRELYRGIHFEMSHRKDATGEHTSMGNTEMISKIDKVKKNQSNSFKHCNDELIDWCCYGVLSLLMSVLARVPTPFESDI